MLRARLYVSVYLLLICCAVSFSAQQAAPGAANAVVPPVIKFSGVLSDVNDKPLTGTVGVTFSLYKESQGGAALWIETQNVTPDKNGHYSVMLGSTTSQGIPSDVFASGEARWLGVQAQGQAEQPRTLLLSVEKGVLWARSPQAMQQWKEARTKAAASNQMEASPKP